jgi:hypothetical protein
MGLVMKIKIDIAIATQITQTMFNGTEAVPKSCYRSCSTLCGAQIGEASIMFIPRTLKGRMLLKVGDWVINSPLVDNVLSDEEFKEFNLKEIK